MALDTPPVASQPSTDAEHLNVLAIFHFVLAALCILGLGFMLIYYLLMYTPAAMNWMSVLLGGILTVCGLGNCLSGSFIKRQTHWGFSVSFAILNCLIVPFGTFLGLYTLVVLFRQSVKRGYAASSGV